MNKLRLILLVLLIWLQYSLWFGKNGFYDCIRINNKVKEQKVKREKFKIRNSQLFIEINDLSNGQELIEENARSELSMTKSNETFYRLIPNLTRYNQDSLQNN